MISTCLKKYLSQTAKDFSKVIDTAQKACLSLANEKRAIEKEFNSEEGQKSVVLGKAKSVNVLEGCLKESN